MENEVKEVTLPNKEEKKKKEKKLYIYIYGSCDLLTAKESCILCACNPTGGCARARVYRKRKGKRM